MMLDYLASMPVPVGHATALTCRIDERVFIRTGMLPTLALESAHENLSSKRRPIRSILMHPA
jgi:hypothetical protein